MTPEGFPLDWESLKMRQAEESGFRCDVCGRERELYVMFREHPLEDGSDAGFELGNLTTRCATHAGDEPASHMMVGLQGEGVELPAEWDGVKLERLRMSDGCEECGVLDREMFVVPTVSSGEVGKFDTELLCGEHVPARWERQEMVVDGRQADRVSREEGLEEDDELYVESVGGRADGLGEWDVLAGSGYWGVLRDGVGGLWTAGAVGAGVLGGVGAGVLDVGVSSWMVGVMLFAVVYVAGLLRRDYADERWPGEWWVPRDRGFLRPVMVGVGVAGGAALLDVGVGEGWWVLASAVDVAFVAGVAWMLVQAHYVVVKGVRDGVLELYPWAWDAGLRVSAVIGVVGVGGLAPVWVQFAVVGVGVAFVVRASVGGVEWSRPRGRGEVGLVGRVRLAVLRVFDRVGEVVERARRNEVAGVERGRED